MFGCGSRKVWCREVRSVVREVEVEEIVGMTGPNDAVACDSGRKEWGAVH